MSKMSKYERRMDMFRECVEKVDSNVFKGGVYRIVKMSLKKGDCGDLSDAHLSDLPAEEQKRLVTWVAYNFYPSKNFLHFPTSYRFTNTYAKRARIDITHNQFKEAMLMNDFYPEDASELNWTFRIKGSSPAMQVFRDGKFGIPMVDREYLNDVGFKYYF